MLICCYSFSASWSCSSKPSHSHVNFQTLDHMYFQWSILTCLVGQDYGHKETAKLCVSTIRLQSCYPPLHPPPALSLVLRLVLAANFPGEEQQILNAGKVVALGIIVVLYAAPDFATVWHSHLLTAMRAKQKAACHVWLLTGASGTRCHALVRLVHLRVQLFQCCSVVKPVRHGLDSSSYLLTSSECDKHMISAL